MRESQTHIAVLTGDLVASTKLGPKKIDRAFKALEDCARIQKDWHGSSLHFTRHRGDGWQVVLARPEMALRSALAFRAALKALGEEFDSYIGGSDKGESALKFSPNLNDETGDTFQFSGIALGWSKGSDDVHRMSFLPIGEKHALFILADRIARGWTKAQAEALLPFLDPTGQPTATQVAENLGKSRQAVSKAIDAANHDSLIAALLSLEAAKTNA